MRVLGDPAFPAPAPRAPTAHSRGPAITPSNATPAFAGDPDGNAREPSCAQDDSSLSIQRISKTALNAEPSNGSHALSLCKGERLLQADLECLQSCCVAKPRHIRTRFLLATTPVFWR